ARTPLRGWIRGHFVPLDCSKTRFHRDTETLRRLKATRDRVFQHSVLPRYSRGGRKKCDNGIGGRSSLIYVTLRRNFERNLVSCYATLGLARGSKRIVSA